MSSSELHQKIFTFLAGEFGKEAGHQCVSVELLYAPGSGYKDEPVRDWVRANSNETELFEMGKVTDFATMIMDIAESEADAKPAGKHRYVIRTKQHLGGRATMSFALMPAFTGTDETALATAAASGGSSRQDSTLLANHANQLMRTNTQMFDGTVRILGSTNERLNKENADLRAENILLRREVEEARSNKLEREFQVAMAADKNARANQGFQKFMQLTTAVAAKFVGGNNELGAGQPGSLQMLLAEFGKSLRPEQVQVLQNALDMPQKVLFMEIMKFVMEQDSKEQAQQQQANGAAQPGAPT